MVDKGEAQFIWFLLLGFELLTLGNRQQHCILPRVLWYLVGVSVTILNEGKLATIFHRIKPT